jgi:hypothetical protein
LRRLIVSQPARPYNLQEIVPSKSGLFYFLGQTCELSLKLSLSPFIAFDSVHADILELCNTGNSDTG